jgi:hypothetical protein
MGMSFLLNRRLDDFARELDFDQLLAVNGGCGGAFTGDSGYTGGGGENHGYNPYGSGSSSPSSSGTCSGGTSSIPHQTAYDPEHVDHCDIIAYNETIDHGIKDPGAWNGNKDNVKKIYENNYTGKGSDTAQSNTSGYVFYDCDNNGTYEHMEYYSAGAGNKYTCWTTDGITNPVPVTYDSTVDSNGHAKTGKATFVSLN